MMYYSSPYGGDWIRTEWTELDSYLMSVAGHETMNQLGLIKLQRQSLIGRNWFYLSIDSSFKQTFIRMDM